MSHVLLAELPEEWPEVLAELGCSVMLLAMHPFESPCAHISGSLASGFRSSQLQAPVSRLISPESVVSGKAATPCLASGLVAGNAWSLLVSPDGDRRSEDPWFSAKGCSDMRTTDS